MKNKIYTTLPAAAIAFASWLLPTLSLGSVLVDGVSYELDEAAKTAVVAPGSDKSIEYLTIPENITYEGVTYTVTAIADCAFLGCDNLFSVDIKSHSLAYIGYSAFERCYSLDEIRFTEGLTEFNYEAFKKCDNLRNVSFPSTLKVIGDRSFMGCSSLRIINVPAKVEYIGEQWVSGCPLGLLIAERKEPLPIKANRFKGIDKENCILCVPEGSTTAYQNANVWKDFLNIREGIIEEGQCGEDVFYSISVDKTARVWGNGRMDDFKWGISVSDIGSFFVEDLTIEEGVTYIGNYAFMQWEKLSSINIPSSLTGIGQYAFHFTDWYNNQPEGVVYLGKWVYDLLGLNGTDVVILDGTVGHSNSAFIHSDITSLSIPSSMTYIYPAVYLYDDGHYFDYAFGDIGSIVVDPGNPIYDSRDDCNAIIETASNTLIAGSRNMVIPDGVTTIGPFVYGYQTSALIPANVTNVDIFAFCTFCYIISRSPEEGYAFLAPSLIYIESVKMEGSVPPAISVTNPSMKYNFHDLYFAGIGGEDGKECTLYVPFGSKEAYQNAPGWKDFKYIEEYDPEGGTTAIETINASTSAPRQIFDLQGRRLNDASSHSIVIENGRKRIQR